MYKENKNTCLIIIGGRGKEYGNTLKFIQKQPSKENIIVIKNVSNPYVILKKCDYFVLSSFYEGFGLVIAEADILNKPVISTNVVGPRGFLEQNKGTLVENNEEGLYKGVKSLVNNEISTMNVNYEQYNCNAIKEFYKVLEKNS